MNPDNDFVLRGRNSSYWSRPGYLSSSQLTTTTRDLRPYSSQAYDNYLTQSLRNQSQKLNHLSSSLRETLRAKDLDYIPPSSTLRSNSYHSYKDDWYTCPVHRTSLDTSEDCEVCEMEDSAARIADANTLATSDLSPIATSRSEVTLSPYQQAVYKLRLDRLKIEEDHLLELKRQLELERIRGPRPKWYEMKSPLFHYEAHKNNELLRLRKKWNDLLLYRIRLLAASNAFNRSYNLPLV